MILLSPDTDIRIKLMQNYSYKSIRNWDTELLYITSEANS